MLGWMNNWQYASDIPTSPFRGQMTLPRKLSLETTTQGIRLVQQPVDGLAKLRESPTPLQAAMLGIGHQFEFTSTIQMGTASEVGWKVLAADGTFTSITYNKPHSTLSVDRTHSGKVDFNKDFPTTTEAPLKLDRNTLQMDVVVDRDSVEVFAENGRVTLTNLVFPPNNADNLQFYANGGKAGTVSGTLWKLRSAWTR
jgi:sucrose-6-phosphate hydrolase SacC (GH32 family)